MPTEQLIITTPIGKQFDLLSPNKDDIQVEDVLEQLQQINMYVDRDYTALHRCNNVANYLTAMGVDHSHVYNWLGNCMLYSYNVYDTRYPITIGLSPFVTPFGLPLKNRLRQDFGIRHGVSSDVIGYIEQITMWEMSVMYPNLFDRDLYGVFNSSYLSDLFFKDNLMEMKASLYDKINFSKRRHTR